MDLYDGVPWNIDDVTHREMFLVAKRGIQEVVFTLAWSSMTLAIQLKRAMFFDLTVYKQCR